MTNTSAPTSVPTRTCVGCGEKGSRDDLVRIVVARQSTLVVDTRKQMPGRGAWLHPDRACADKARRSGRLLRSLRLGETDNGTWMTVEDFFAAKAGCETPKQRKRVGS